ncbi:hypothetical protein V6N13_104712 [Hibiscus sabdariffa]|uniref:Uncharacterized protein n=1 Tax=Hibiscus sabdariffa TaxID=183260 RepID=A0ABR2SIM5_9ROSI
MGTRSSLVHLVGRIIDCGRGKPTARACADSVVKGSLGVDYGVVEGDSQSLVVELNSNASKDSLGVVGKAKSLNAIVDSLLSPE